MEPLTDAELTVFVENAFASSGDRPSSPTPLRPEHPRHGEHVHYGFKTTPFAEGASMESIVETWCEHCGRWIQTNGVLGPFRFYAYHDPGDCHEDTGD